MVVNWEALTVQVLVMDGMVHWTVQTLPVMTEVEQPPGGAAIVTSAGLVPYINMSNML